MPGSKITMAEWSNTWLQSKMSKAYNTWHRYESLINVHIIPMLGNLRISEINTDHIENLINSALDKGQECTARKIYTTLRQILERARKRGLILVLQRKDHMFETG